MPAILLFVLSGFFGSIPAAHAQEKNTCSADTLAWVARADAAFPASVRAVQCFPAHVRLKLHIDSAHSLDVDIAHPAGQAFRRMGRLGVSPILEVDDFRNVPAPQREAFETLCTWLSAHETEVLQPKVPEVPVLRHLTPIQESSSIGNFWSRGAWAGLALLLVFINVRAARKATNTAHGERDWFALVGLFGFALVLRVAFGPFGPHHVNGQGPLWILGAATDATRLVGYGPGYVELFSFVCTLFPKHPDAAIFICNAIFGALAAPLVFALARKLEVDFQRAIVAGVIMAIDAIALRFGATEAYFPSIITLTLTASVLFVSAAQRLRANHKLGAFFLALVGSLVSAQAARIHPIAWGPVALGPLFVLAMPSAQTNVSPSWKHWARQGAWSVTLALLVMVVIVLTSGKAIVSVAANVHEHWDARAGGETVALRLVEHAPVGLVLLAVAFVLAKPRGLLVPAMASALALVATRNAYGQSQVWIASYDRLWIAAPLIVLVSMIPASVACLRHAWVLLGAATIGALAAGWPTMNERTTEQLEHGFFRSAFAALPDGCRVVHVPRVGKRIVALPEYAIESPAKAPRAVVAVSSADDVRRLQRPEGCLRYARTSICTSDDGRPVCEAIERGLHLVPIVERVLPAKPSHVTSTYDRDIVGIGLFEVREP